MSDNSLTVVGGHGDLVPYDAGALDQNPAAVYLAGLSVGSRRTMRDALNKIAALVGKVDLDQVRREQGKEAARSLCLSFPWSELRYQHTAAIRAALAEQYAAATANKMLTALRRVLHQAWRLRQLSSDDYQRAVDLDPVKGETLPAGRDVTPGELSALAGACQDDSSPSGSRDGAILAALYCGLRREEVVKLDLADYDQSAGTLLVKGKRNKQRLVPVVGGASEALGDWLAIRGGDPGPLFVQVARGGYVQDGQRLTPQAIYFILGQRALQAGVKALSPHDLRRTLAGDLLDSGADLVTVQKILGHSDPKTTARYDRRGERAKKQAAGKVHFPWRQRAF